MKINKAIMSKVDRKYKRNSEGEVVQGMYVTDDGKTFPYDTNDKQSRKTAKTLAKQAEENN